jgi:UDP-N-acetylmuramate dehydrogenase
VRQRYPLAQLEQELGEGRLTIDEPLAPLTTFHIGGPADLFFRARTTDELVRSVAAARRLEIPYFLLGLGANILVGDRGFRGLVIRNEAAGVEWLADDRVRVESGARLFPELTTATVARGLAGLHHFVGIPTTVGGAMWQNLHFLSPPPARERTVFIEEVVEGCELLGADGERFDVDREYLRFGYDYSILHDRPDVVLAVVFQLKRADPCELQEVVRANLEWRDERHPDLWLYPCAGSIFRKIEGIGAGRLIDQCGLKGHRHGNAQIFHKHANIIVNLGGATAADVMALIDLARETVRRELGYELIPEIGMIGEF